MKKKKNKKLRMAIGFSILGFYFILIILGLAIVTFNPEGFWIALPFVAIMAGLAILSAFQKDKKEILEINNILDQEEE